MKFKIFVFALLLISACSKPKLIEKETRMIQIDASHENSALVITNEGTETAYFTININGIFASNIDSLINFINMEYPNMHDAEKVWRFISNYSIHNDLITKNNWLYNPVLLLNSAGGSHCGYRSAAMTNILKRMGHEARSWCINGHVISEVFVDEKWQVYDADLGSIYFNQHNQIASFEELCADTSLITSGKIKCITNVCDSLMAIKTELAEMYASTSDNNIFHTDFPVNILLNTKYIYIPSGAKITFPKPDNNNSFAFLELELPANFTGLINQPFIPYNFSGDAEVYYKGKLMDNNTTDWNEAIANSKILSSIIYVKENHNGIILRYYINPFIYEIKASNHIKLYGENLDNLKFEIEENIKNITPNWIQKCDENIDIWHKIIKNNLNNTTIDSKESLINFINVIIDEYNSNQPEINKQDLFPLLEHYYSKYKKTGNLNWEDLNNADKFTELWHKILQKYDAKTN